MKSLILVLAFLLFGSLIFFGLKLLDEQSESKALKAENQKAVENKRSKIPENRRRTYHIKIPTLTSEEKEYLQTGLNQAEKLIGLKVDFVNDFNGKVLYENIEIIDWNPNGPQIKIPNGNIYRVEYWRLDEESKKKLGYDKKFDEIYRVHRRIEYLRKHRRAIRI